MSLKSKVKKTFGKQLEKKDKSSELFDAMMSSPKKSKTPSLPTRTSPRKKPGAPAPISVPKISSPMELTREGEGDAFDFKEESSPHSVQGIQLSDEEESSPAEISRMSSQGSLSGKVGNVSLSSPPRSKLKKSPPSNEIKASPPKKPKPDEPMVKLVGKRPIYRHTWNEEEEEETIETMEFKEPDPPKMQPPANPPPKRFFKSGLTPGNRHNPPPNIPNDNANSSADASMRSVARKVKEAHSCLEDGEMQEYKDEVQYLLETLKSADSAELKCLTVMNLSRKCLKSTFRQFLRAKNVPSKVFSMLQDSDKCSALAMCTSLVLYLLARDRLSLAIDSRTLQLILRLINCTPNKDDLSYSKYRSQSWEILSQWKSEVVSSLTEQQSSVFIFDVTPSNISPNFLVVEALVFISTRKTDGPFKQAMREFQGLQLLVQCVENEMNSIEESVKIDFFERLKMLQRYLRILENVTLMHQSNQIFLISHRSCILIELCVRLLHVCRTNLCNMSNGALLQSAHKSNSDPVKLLDDCLSAVIRLLCNLSNNNELCCVRLGQSQTFLQDSLALITFVAPVHLPPDLRFDLVVLVSGLLSNVVEHCSENRRRVTQSTVPFCAQPPSASQDEIVDALPVQTPAVEALTKLLLRHLQAAETADAEMDEHMEKPFAQARQDATSNLPVRMPSANDLKKTVEEALNKAGQHMEDTILASYIALLLGLLVQHSEEVMVTVRQLMPSADFKPMVEVLNKFLEFMDMASSSEHKKGQKVIARIVEALQDLDK